MASITSRMAEPPYFPDVWPGEHYRLLAGLMAACRPGLVVEIGTGGGLSALAMLQTLPRGGRLVTFDIVPWHKFPGTSLRQGDFASGTLTQILGDVSEQNAIQAHAALFEEADFIFVDGPKDGTFERTLLDRLASLHLSRGPLIVLDDIRIWNMLAIWRAIRLPKLDLTSFGHWSGTGLVDWSLTSATHPGQEHPD